MELNLFKMTEILLYAIIHKTFTEFFYPLTNKVPIKTEPDDNLWW